MLRVVLVIGHSNESQGAVNLDTGISEYIYNKAIATSLLQREDLKDIDLIIKKRTTDYASLPSEINSLNPDLIVSLHCNAYNQTINGTETLYYINSEISKKIAMIFQNNMVLNLKINNRGIKGILPKDRGGHLLVGTKAPCIILEPLFIDVASPSILLESKNKIANAIFDSLTMIKDNESIKL